MDEQMQASSDSHCVFDEKALAFNDEEKRNLAASKLQCLFRCRKARNQLRELIHTLFERYYDETYGAYYYYNKRTGDTTWIKPRGLKADEEIPLAGIYQNKTMEIESKVKDSPGNLNLSKARPINRDKNSINKSNESLETREKIVKAETNADLQNNNTVVNKVENGDEDEENDDDGKVDNGIPFTQEERSLIYRQFRQYDTDGSGSISPQELQQLLISLGEPVSMGNVEKLISEVDENRNGEIEFHEFLQIMANQQHKNPYSASLRIALLYGPKELDKLRRQFMEIDLDGSGEIDEAELRALITKIQGKEEASKVDIRKLLEEVDLDHNGSVSFNEFLHVVTRMLQSPEQTGFSSVLHKGMSDGILNDLKDVVKNSSSKLYNWWHASQLRAAKYQAELRNAKIAKAQQLKLAQEREAKVYQDHLETEKAITKAREVYIDGLDKLVEFEGDGLNFPLVGQYARIHYVGWLATPSQVKEIQEHHSKSKSSKDEKPLKKISEAAPSILDRKDENIFESSRKRGVAFEVCIGAGHTIKGFDFALQRMSIGETAIFIIAPHLGYGVRGQPPKIPRDATLIFKIELISIKEKQHLAKDATAVDAQR